MTQPYDLQAIQNALATWAATAGVTVAYLYDGGPQPRHPYIGLYVMDVTSPEHAETYHTYNGAAPLGAEITLYQREQRKICVQVSAYSEAKANAAGNGSALQILEKALDNLRTYERVLALRAAGISLISKGKIHRRPFLEGSAWVDCALTEVRFNVAAVVSSTVGYITEAVPDGDIS